MHNDHYEYKPTCLDQGLTTYNFAINSRYLCPATLFPWIKAIKNQQAAYH